MVMVSTTGDPLVGVVLAGGVREATVVLSKITVVLIAGEKSTKMSMSLDPGLSP